MTDSSHPETFVEGEQLGVPALLDALTDLVERARAMPMSSSVLVNRNEALDLLDELREQLPTQLTRADEVLSDAGSVLDDARDEAERIVAMARERAHALVAQEEIVRQAQEQAQGMVAAAQHHADQLRHEADDYCDRRLAEFEIDLGKLVTQVQAGRAKLGERLADHN
ncbi:hypothetical protein [Jonesia quinghaiensis]|uniref:hypothetical protein n=1 Tax=Jonesia quinghaiensis TaxID=262806 RepID=UPI0004176D99|nr:hypothetical protein [Jonesia quinghaiensis]